MSGIDHGTKLYIFCRIAQMAAYSAIYPWIDITGHDVDSESLVTILRRVDSISSTYIRHITDYKSMSKLQSLLSIFCRQFVEMTQRIHGIRPGQCRQGIAGENTLSSRHIFLHWALILLEEVLSCKIKLNL
jgi:hypothetical protein